MSEHELLLSALGKLVYMWSPVWMFGIYLLFILDKGEKEREKNRQAIKMARREERNVT